MEQPWIPVPKESLRDFRRNDVKNETDPLPPVTNCMRRINNSLLSVLSTELYKFKQFSLTIGVIEELQRGRNNNDNVEGSDE